jgi:hypothetical protein
VLIIADWATATAGIVGALVGATAAMIGSLLNLKGNRLNIEHEEREAWRTRQIEAAQAFISECTAAIEQLGGRMADEYFDEPKMQDLVATGAATARSQALLAVLFGDSPAGQTADDVAEHLSTAIGTLARLPERDDPGYKAAKKKLDEAVDSMDDAFMKLVGLINEELRPKAA